MWQQIREFALPDDTFDNEESTWTADVGPTGAGTPVQLIQTLEPYQVAVGDGMVAWIESGPGSTEGVWVDRLMVDPVGDRPPVQVDLPAEVLDAPIGGQGDRYGTIAIGGQGDRYGTIAIGGGWLVMIISLPYDGRSRLIGFPLDAIDLPTTGA